MSHVSCFILNFYMHDRMLHDEIEEAEAANLVSETAETSDVADTPIEITLSPKRSPSEWSETPEIETLTASLESDDKSDHELSKQMENMLV